MRWEPTKKRQGNCSPGVQNFFPYYSLVAFVGAFSTLGPIQTVWTFTNSWIPKEESSRPYPLCLTPPKGRRALHHGHE